MAESPMTNRADETDALWELIPWYVNGSLGAAETRAVEARRDADPAFAAEIERQSALAAGLAMQEVPDLEAAEARSIASLRARIEAEDRARTAAAPAGQAWWTRWLPDLGRGGFAAAGTACAALVAVLFLSGVMTGNTPDGPGGDYRTLTSDPGAPGTFIKFQPAGGVTRAALERLLAEHGMELVGDASETGVFRARLRDRTGQATGTGTDEGLDTDALAGTLMQAEEILFAAPE